jgi:hypothetical protein
MMPGLELLQAALQGALTSNMFAIIIAVLVFSCINMFSYGFVFILPVFILLFYSSLTNLLHIC